MCRTASSGHDLVAGGIRAHVGARALELVRAGLVDEDRDAEALGAAPVVADGEHDPLDVVADPAGALALGKDRVERGARVGEQVGADVHADVRVAHLPVQDAGDDFVHAS
jgi:hypothetical protein